MRNDASLRRRGSAFGIEADGGSESRTDLLGEPLDRRRTQTDDDSAAASLGRGRSFSASLGELWKGLKGRASREDFRDRDDEEGGAGGR
jgi:hypothetical protein